MGNYDQSYQNTTDQQSWYDNSKYNTTGYEGSGYDYQTDGQYQDEKDYVAPQYEYAEGAEDQGESYGEYGDVYPNEEGYDEYGASEDYNDEQYTPSSSKRYHEQSSMGGSRSVRSRLGERVDTNPIVSPN